MMLCKGCMYLTFLDPIFANCLNPASKFENTLFGQTFLLDKNAVFEDII